MLRSEFLNIKVPEKISAALQEIMLSFTWAQLLMMRDKTYNLFVSNF